MCGCISNCCSIWHNADIPGHHLASPGIWLVDTAQRIVSRLPSDRCEALLEVIKRIFLSLIILIASIPIALFSLLVAFPTKYFGSICCQPESKPDPLVGLSSDSSIEEKSLSSSEKEIISPEVEPPTLSPPPSGTLLKSAATRKRVEADGNCAFKGFMREMKRNAHPLGLKSIEEFRSLSAKWIAENVKKDPKLAALLLESIEEYLEVSLEWLKLEETQIPINIQLLKLSGIEKENAEKRLREIPTLKKEVESQISQVKKANSLDEILQIKENYLLSIQNDKDTERVYASRAHYYAFCRMFKQPARIEIYLERELDYNLIAVTKAPKEPYTTIRFVHSGQNHVDILIIN